MTSYQDLFVEFGSLKLVTDGFGFLVDPSKFWKVIMVSTRMKGPLCSGSLDSDMGSSSTSGGIILFDYVHFYFQGYAPMEKLEVENHDCDGFLVRFMGELVVIHPKLDGTWIVNNMGDNPFVNDKNEVQHKDELKVFVKLPQSEMVSKIEDKGQVFDPMSQREAGSLVADVKGLEFSDYAPLYEVDDVSADYIISQLLFLDAEDQQKDIKLFINSPGGSVIVGICCCCPASS